MIFYGKTFAEKQREQKGRDYGKLEAEIERLRLERNQLDAMLRKIRNATKEECALVALEWPRQEMGIALSIAVAIRARKDRP